jgi:hypothetical protein
MGGNRPCAEVVRAYYNGESWDPDQVDKLVQQYIDHWNYTPNAMDDPNLDPEAVQMYDVGRILQPGLTWAQFLPMWEEFLELRAQHEREKQRDSLN